MWRVFVVAVALAMGIIFAQAAGATPYYLPRQLPWPTGVQHGISGYTYLCGTHDRFVASSSSAYNADAYGIDFGLAFGEPVTSVAVGRVIFASDADDGYGYKVVLDHGDGVYTIYAHFGSPGNPAFGPGIVAGKFLPQGAVLGYAGYSGFTTGSHLHFHLQAGGGGGSGLTANPASPLSNYDDFGSYGISAFNGFGCSTFVPSPSYISTQSDTDLDDYPDNHENYWGTKPDADCPLTSTANDEAVDSWPYDFDDNQTVNLTDILQAYGGWINVPVPPAPPRINLFIDNIINMSDVLGVSPVFNTSCN